MPDRIQQIVTTLPGLANVTGVWETAERSLARGDAGFVVDLGIAVAAAHDAAAEPVWQYHSVLDHLLGLLATTPGPGNAARALRLLSAAHTGDGAPHRHTASRLASTHPVEELAVAFTADASEELRACLVHELVLRGVPVTRTPGVAGWATSPHLADHPLGWLPLELSDVEGDPELPRPGGHGRRATPDGRAVRRRVRADPGAVPPLVEETTTGATAREVGAAVAGWAEKSNGRVEARVFRLGAPPEAGAVPGVLVALGLECLDGVGAGLTVDARPPGLAWRELFVAASDGGAYTAGGHGAYGRLATWRSLAGLSGAGEADPAEEVAARVRECAWYGFAADTPWFEFAGWDVGLAAVRAPRRRLAVLAATDTN